MCGVLGILCLDGRVPVHESALRTIASTLAHRGPDAEGIWMGGGVGLAHRRLSIIDLTSGEQPMTNEDGTIRVIFNGEIYNYRRLKEELESKGHRFKTHSDTEVLVHLYEEQSDELVHRLRGMFAFALWDERRQRMLLARDRIGLKPLFYYVDGNKLLFGSEIKAILAWPGIDRSVDAEALEDYLALGFIPGERSIFRRIRKLPPGHTLTISRDDFRPRLRRYWQLEAEPNTSLTAGEWIEATRAKFTETVEVHRIADVPVGAFLSGGLDSSAVTAAFAKSSPNGIQTFSIGFREERFSELPYARLVSERFGTQHVEEIVTADAAQSLDDLVTFFDEPFADPSAIPTMCVSKLARKHVKVVLSGDGGDEAFGGYKRYAHDLREAAVRNWMPGILRRSLVRPLARVWPKADWLPRHLRLKTALTNVSLDPARAYANSLSLSRQPLRRKLLHPDIRNRLNGHCPELRIARSFGEHSKDPLRGMISSDINVLLPDDFLTKVDRASMSVGLEVRPPLVDHEFLEHCARIPSELKIREGETKWLFKQICDGWLPDSIVHRPKQGFDIPVDDWLRGPLRATFEDRVLSPSAAVGGLIDPNQAQRLYKKHLSGVGRHGNTLWSLLILGVWADRYLTGAPADTEHASHSNS